MSTSYFFFRAMQEQLTLNVYPTGQQQNLFCLISLLFKIMHKANNEKERFSSLF